MNARSEPEHIKTFLCGDCAAVERAQGAEEASAAGLSLTQLCEYHPGPLSPLATSCVFLSAERRAFLRAELERAAASEAETPDEGIPGLPPPWGPLAPSSARVWQTAKDLLVAWSTADKGASCDEYMIALAVNSARKLVKAVGG